MIKDNNIIYNINGCNKLNLIMKNIKMDIKIYLNY